MLSVDRVVLVNLRRRPDRLEAFRLLQGDRGWELPEPEVLPAVDGQAVGVPAGFSGGAGAWGCKQSHVRILDDVLSAGQNSVLVFEDDLTWKADAWDALRQFLSAVPGDWDQLMLGGQHCGNDPPTPVSPGVVRCVNAQRTHAYAVRGAALKDLLKLWYGATRHIDHHMGPWQRKWKVYAPDPFVFGQAAGKSDICGKDNPPKFWSVGPPDAPVVHLTAPPPAAAALRAAGLHFGYTRDAKTGYDAGLVKFAKSPRPAALTKWLAGVLGEAAAADTVVCVWHPQVTADHVRAAHAGAVYEVAGETAGECLERLPADVRKVLRQPPSSPPVVVLRVPVGAAEALRARGWHRGHWRDPVTGQDNGLRAAAGLAGDARAAKLREVVRLLADEAAVIPNGLACVWHPDVSADEVRAAVPGTPVVEIEAPTAAKAVEKLKGAAGGR